MSETKKTMNILLVEDDDVDVMTVRRAFKKNNLHTSSTLYIANDGPEAFQMLRGEVEPAIPGQNRLILLDLNMPKMNGIEFLTHLRADPKLRLIPVIILTTSDEDRDKVEAYNLNVAGYIIKPVTFNKFVEAFATINEYWTLNEII